MLCEPFQTDQNESNCVFSIRIFNGGGNRIAAFDCDGYELMALIAEHPAGKAFKIRRNEDGESGTYNRNGYRVKGSAGWETTAVLEEEKELEHFQEVWRHEQ